MSPWANVHGSVDAAVSIEIAARRLELPGHLSVPAQPSGLVVFVHAADGDHRSPSDRHVAQRLVGAGIGALRFDLFSADERAHGDDRDLDRDLDADLLAVRVLAATRWLRDRPDVGDGALGYFGTASGAGIALLAAAEDPSIAALVAFDGEPELAGARLSAVRASTLLLVDGDDGTAVARNEDAARHLRCEHSLVLVPGASHHHDGSSLQTVADCSVGWFTRHLHASSDTDRRTEAP
jgi:dienelactone hydrolase